MKKLLGLVEMTTGLVNASLSLPEWQAVKMNFFAPWIGHLLTPKGIVNVDLSYLPKRTKFFYSQFSHDITKIQTWKLLILLHFYFHEVLHTVPYLYKCSDRSKGFFVL